MKLFEMKHIKKSFGSLEVLKDISLEVEEGEVLSIIGQLPVPVNLHFFGVLQDLRHRIAVKLSNRGMWGWSSRILICFHIFLY